MHTFTIRDIENLTGIKAHTLRIWEQRYDFFRPRRKDSLHRIYDNEDLKQLLRISFLYHQGWKVSKIAGLSSNQIADEVRKLGLVTNYQQYVNRLIETAVSFDETSFIEQINAISSRIGFEDCIIKVCYPYLHKLGLLWSTNNVIPAQEHFSSYLIQNRIIAETESLPRMRGPVQIILLCPKGEYHELPLLFINYLFRKRSANTLYLGSNVRMEDLQPLLANHPKADLYLHLITNFTGTTVEDYLQDFCRIFSERKVLASGEGIRYAERNPSNLTLLKTDEEIMNRINQYQEEVSSKA